VRPAFLFAAALAALLALSPGAALARPGLEATLGGTLAIEGAPDEGGWSVSLSPMWPLEERWSFGAMLFADDMGAEFGRLSDPNDGMDLGAAELGHAYVLGAAWRLDREWGSLLTWMPYASGTWGYYRVIDDLRGEVTQRAGSTGFSLGGGVRRAINDRNAIGASVRYHRLFNDRLGRYVGWAVDWSFR
jgi:hypothetical protein